MKTCIKCGSTKFTAAGACDPCKKAYNAMWREKNKEKETLRLKEWRKNNLERQKKTQAVWYEANKEKAIATAAKWHKDNPEKVKKIQAASVKKHIDRVKAYRAKYYAENAKRSNEANAKWRKENPLKEKERKKAYRAANPEKCKQIQINYSENNKEKIKARKAKYVAENLELSRVHNNNRRARKKASGGSISKGLTEKLFLLQKGRCACCGVPLEDDYHIDHIVPLYLGGSNSDENIQLLRSICNLQKGKKHPVDFMQSKGLLL